MSFVICMTGSNYTVMMSDGLEVVMDITTNEIQEYKQDYKKIMKINEDVCIGLMGDAIVAKAVFEKCKEYGNYNLNKIKKELLPYIKQINNSPLGLNIIISGRENGVYETYQFISFENYKEKAYIPQGNFMACVYGKPSDVMVDVLNQIVKFNIYDNIHNIKSVDDLILHMGNCIYDVSKKSKTVNNVVFIEGVMGNGSSRTR